MPFKRLFFLSVPILILLDQVTKIWIRVNLPTDAAGRALTREGVLAGRAHRIEIIPGFFDIIHVENKGAAWGILADAEYRLVFFVAVTLIAFAVILSYYRQLRSDDRLHALSLCLIFAGAAGNFIDRLLYKQVTDFLDFYATGKAAPFVAKILGSTHWPAFNVADMCICIGVGLFAWHIIFVERKRALSPDPGSAKGQDLPGDGSESEQPCGDEESRSA